MIRFNVKALGVTVPVTLDFTYHQVNGRRLTIASVLDDGTGEKFIGYCLKDSRDTDNKEVARKTALKKLMASASFEKEIRKQIWNGYFGRSKKYLSRQVSV